LSGCCAAAIAIATSSNNRLAFVALLPPTALPQLGKNHHPPQNKCPPGKNVEVEGMAKRLEECLWGEANTLEAYMNDETLERRMLTVSKMILERSSSTVNKNSTV